MIINGTKIAEDIYADVKTQVETLEVKPTLGVILVGDNAASLRYISQKEKWANHVGIHFKLFQLPESINEAELLEQIQDLNKSDEISGLMVQLPLPLHINPTAITNAISPLKDVDGFHPENQGKVMIGDISGFSPCTPAGIMKIFEHENTPLEGKIITVIGRSNIVGKPIANMLINSGATVLSCNSKTPDLINFTRKADIVISAAGVPNLIKIDMIRMGITVIDVGFTVVNGKIHGDCDFNNIEPYGNSITPVPGGVGPLTVAMLMSNTLKAAIQKKVEKK